MLLHPSVIERFTAHAPGLTGVTRRTLRTSLRFLARCVVPQLAPADRPLPREHAKAPYSTPEIDGYLALAAAQRCRCGRVHVAPAPEWATGAPGTVTYGLRLQALCVFLLVMRAQGLVGCLCTDAW